MRKMPRLYYGEDVKVGVISNVPDKQYKYLKTVLKMHNGSEFLLFNEHSGEFLCELLVSGRKLMFCPKELVQKSHSVDGLCLSFSMIKQHKICSIFRQGTEMGVTSFVPFISSRSTSHNFNIQRYYAVVAEAAEQCGRVDIPKIIPPVDIKSLKNIKCGFRNILCNEAEQNKYISDVLGDSKSMESINLIVGPEGGFSEQELEYFCAFCDSISLGTRTLKVDTAIVTALAYINFYKHSLSKI